MSKKRTPLHRRRFLKTALSAAGAVVAAPTIIPSSALGLNGAVAPSERIVIGGIGIGRRGGYDLGCFLEQKDVQFVAVCDIKKKRRGEVKKIVDDNYGNQNCDTYRDFRELLDRNDIDASTSDRPKISTFESLMNFTTSKTRFLRACLLDLSIPPVPLKCSIFQDRHDKSTASSSTSDPV